MEGLNVELIIQAVSAAGTALIALLLFFPKLRSYVTASASNEAAAVDSNVSASKGVVEMMQVLATELRAESAVLKLNLTKAETEIAEVKRDSARKDLEHDQQVNTLNERVQLLEKQVKEERDKREKVEEENKQLREKVEKTQERVRKLEEFLREQGYDPDEVVKKKSGS